MKITVLILSLWACSALAIPTITAPPPAVAPAVAPPPAVAPAVAPPPAVAPAVAPAPPTVPAPPAPAVPVPPVAPAAPVAPGVTTAPVGTATTPALAPADVVASKYKVSFKLANVPFTANLLSYYTAEYQGYASKVLKALIDLYAEDDTYRETQFIGFRNESGVVADVVLRFANDSKNLISLDALIRSGALGALPVDPASLKAQKDAAASPLVFGMGGGMGCPSPCGAPQQCSPSCSQDCCGSSGSSVSQMGMPFAGGMPQMGAGMPQMGAGMPQMGAGMPQMGAGQCPGSCSNSCAPSCEQSCCGGGAQPPMLG